MKSLLKSVVRRAGYRVTRWQPSSRFEAMGETLTRMREAGYDPRVVIDAGANVGQWTRLVRPIFPAAKFHLIEPQPTCTESLRHFAATTSGLSVHPLAVTQPGIAHLRLIDGGDGSSTGAWVARSDESGHAEIECPASTLDALLADEVSSADRTLLKLDLEGHELAALQGATRLLRVTEAVVTEVQFYAVNGNGRPVFTDVLLFLRERGFELYDYAALSARPRDQRLRMGDVICVRHDSALLADRSWE